MHLWIFSSPEIEGTCPADHHEDPWQGRSDGSRSHWIGKTLEFTQSLEELVMRCYEFRVFQDHLLVMSLGILLEFVRCELWISTMKS